MTPNQQFLLETAKSLIAFWSRAHRGDYTGPSEDLHWQRLLVSAVKLVDEDEEQARLEREFQDVRR